MTATAETRQPSMECEALRGLYADWADILANTPGLTTRLFRAIFDEWHQPTREPEEVTYREETVGGVPGIWALPMGADRSKALLYTHGGGFAVGSAASHPEAGRTRRQGAGGDGVRPGLPPRSGASASGAGGGRCCGL